MKRKQTGGNKVLYGVLLVACIGLAVAIYFAVVKPMLHTECPCTGGKGAKNTGNNCPKDGSDYCISCTKPNVIPRSSSDTCDACKAGYKFNSTKKICEECTTGEKQNDPKCGGAPGAICPCTHGKGVSKGDNPTCDGKSELCASCTPPYALVDGMCKCQNGAYIDTTGKCKQCTDAQKASAMSNQRSREPASCKTDIDPTVTPDSACANALNRETTGSGTSIVDKQDKTKCLLKKVKDWEKYGWVNPSKKKQDEYVTLCHYGHGSCKNGPTCCADYCIPPQYSKPGGHITYSGPNRLRTVLTPKSGSWGMCVWHDDSISNVVVKDSDFGGTNSTCGRADTSKTACEMCSGTEQPSNVTSYPLCVVYSKQLGNGQKEVPIYHNRPDLPPGCVFTDDNQKNVAFNLTRTSYSDDTSGTTKKCGDKGCVCIPKGTKIEQKTPLAAKKYWELFRRCGRTGKGWGDKASNDKTCPPGTKCTERGKAGTHKQVVCLPTGVVWGRGQGAFYYRYLPMDPKS